MNYVDVITTFIPGWQDQSAENERRVGPCVCARGGGVVARRRRGGERRVLSSNGSDSDSDGDGRQHRRRVQQHVTRYAVRLCAKLHAAAK